MIYCLGWQFVDSVMTSKETFSGFASKYRNKYRRSKSNGQPFMSLQIFDWFFGR